MGSGVDIQTKVSTLSTFVIIILIINHGIQDSYHYFYFVDKRYLLTMGTVPVSAAFLDFKTYYSFIYYKCQFSENTYLVKERCLQVY